MKKSFLAVILLFFCGSSFAQIEKSSWLVGGNTAFESSKVASINTNSFAFSPTVGYFLIDKLAGGIRGAIVTSKVTGEDAISSTLIGPFFRYYLLEKNSKTNLFLDGNFAFGSSSILGESVNHTGYGFTAGPAFFLNKHTALEITLGYDASKSGNDDVWTNAFKMGVGFQIHLAPSSK